jgi:EmrB/QacA subfamily drug resistance transporter
MVVLDGTIVNVALPDIARDLHLSLSDAQWVGSLYAAVLAALLLIVGAVADRWGRRKLFLVGLTVFVGGSLLAAAADASAALIGARAVQAVGAAMILPTTLSTVNATFRGRHRAAAFGVWGAVISGAAAVGPLAGGALTEYASWPWIFLVNVPLGILVFVGAVLTVRESRGSGTARGLDALGAILSAVGFGAFVFAVIEGPNLGWWAPEQPFAVAGVAWPQDAPVSVIPVMFTVAAAALVGFVAWEAHRARRNRFALLPLRLFRLPTFSWGNTAAGAVAVGEFAVMFVLPLVLVNALGLSIMAAGWVLASLALGAFVAGASARHLSARLGAPSVVVLGLALEVIGTLIVVLILRPTTPGWVIALPLIVYGIGLGLASAQLTSTVLRDVPPAASGQASATQSTVRQVGTALGTALSGAALSVALAVTLPRALDSVGIGAAQAAQLEDAVRGSAGSAITTLRVQGATDAVNALSAGFVDAGRIALLVAVVFLLLGLVASLRVRAVARRN